MKKELEYMLDVIDQLTFTDTYHILDEGCNWVKVTSYELEKATGFDKVYIRLTLSKLKIMKLITNNPKWSGANSGWYPTTRGHDVMMYLRAIKK